MRTPVVAGLFAAGAVVFLAGELGASGLLQIAGLILWIAGAAALVL